MSICLSQDVIRHIFSYGDVNDIPKRKMVFDQLLFLKNEYQFYYSKKKNHIKYWWVAGPPSIQRTHGAVVGGAVAEPPPFYKFSLMKMKTVS